MDNDGMTVEQAIATVWSEDEDGKMTIFPEAIRVVLRANGFFRVGQKRTSNAPPAIVQYREDHVRIVSEVELVIFVAEMLRDEFAYQDRPRSEIREALQALYKYHEKGRFRRTVVSELSEMAQKEWSNVRSLQIARNVVFDSRALSPETGDSLAHSVGSSPSRDEILRHLVEVASTGYNVIYETLDWMTLLMINRDRLQSMIPTEGQMVA